VVHVLSGSGGPSGADLSNRFAPGDPAAGRYDAAGNMVQYGGYAFDAENRLRSAYGTTYSYDGDGNRVSKSGAANMLYWSGAGADTLAESVGASITAEYIFFGGRRVTRLDNPGSAEVPHYYVSDHLGSATVLAHSDGTSEGETMYFPYGGERWSTISGNHYKFTGKERDSETGLDYFGARYYGSNMGRWLSPDWAAAPTAVPYAEFGDPQSLNLYTYIRNNPLSHADADGHDWPAGPTTPEELERKTDVAVGGAKGLWNMVAGTWNTVAGLLNEQGQSSGQPYMEMPMAPMASYDSVAQAVSGAIAQLGTLIYSVVEGATATTGEAAGSEKLAQVQLNKAAGDAFRDEVAASLKAAGRDVATEVNKQTPFGPRRVDIEVSHNGKTLGGIETKTGNSPYKPKQRAKDTYLKEKGYRINVVRKPKDPRQGS
jgi:RHS repeat-associated protein